MRLRSAVETGAGVGHMQMGREGEVQACSSYGDSGSGSTMAMGTAAAAAAIAALAAMAMATAGVAAQWP